METIEFNWVENRVDNTVSTPIFLGASRHTHLYNPLCPSVGWSSSRLVRFVKKIFPVSLQSFIISLIHFFILSFVALIVCGWALSRGSDTVDILSRGSDAIKKFTKKFTLDQCNEPKKKSLHLFMKAKAIVYDCMQRKRKQQFANVPLSVFAKNNL